MSRKIRILKKELSTIALVKHWESAIICQSNEISNWFLMAWDQGGCKHVKTVGVYTRVSSEEQDAQNQMMAIENYCRAKGWNITAIYTESEGAWSSVHQHELSRFL